MAATAECAGLEYLSLAGLPAPVTLRLPVPFSDEDLITFSRKNRPYRIERNAKGELEVMSPVGFEGGQRELFVMIALGKWAEEHGGVCVSSSAGFTLPDGSVRSPDASWISEERYGALTAAERRGFPRICPDFLVELLSESDRLANVAEKMQMWIASGVQLAWMIDPYGGTVTIYRQNVEAEVIGRPDYVEAGSPVAGFKLECMRFWKQ